MEKLNDRKGLNRAWENIKENITTSDKERLGLYEWKQCKPWFDEECSQFLDERRQAKIQWVHDPTHKNVNHVKNVKHEASRHFRNKKRVCLTAKINELETYTKNKNIRDLQRDQ